MSVKIRLTKTGKKHNISFRIVAQDTQTKRDGKFLEILGFWNPQLKSPDNYNIKQERLDFWIAKGAKPTEAVNKLLDQSTKPKEPTDSEKYQMEELLKLLIEPLVSDIKKVQIERISQNDAVSFLISVPKEDIAKVIGREGKMVKSIKNLLKIRAIKENVFATLEIQEI